MIIQSYNDLCYEIEALQERIDSMKREIEYYQKLMHQSAPKDITGICYDGMPKGSRNDMSLDRILEAIGKLESHIYLHQEALYIKKQSKTDIECIMAKMKGLEYQVFYMHKIEKLPLNEIADKLGYSYGYIKNVSSVARCDFDVTDS